MICFTVEGAKRGVAGDRSWVTGRGQIFFNSRDAGHRHVRGDAVPDAVLRLDAGLSPTSSSTLTAPQGLSELLPERLPAAS